MDLREEILLKPLGLTMKREELKEEDAGFLTVWDGAECVGTMVLLEEDPDTARMRFVAVPESRQKRGIGKLMTKEFEAEAARRGYKRIFLHARMVALEFYLKLGYEVFGEEFVQVTIPHRYMQKFIQPVAKDVEPKIEESASQKEQSQSFAQWLVKKF